MRFKELTKGTIFEIMKKDGHTVTAIKTSEKHALVLGAGEELQIYPTKKIDLPRPIRPRDFAIEKETGAPLIVEKVKEGMYLCDYIIRVSRGTLHEPQVSVFDRIRVSRGTLHEPQVSVFDRSQGKAWGSADEVYIIINRAKKAAQQIQNALIMLKDMVEDLSKVT